MYPEIGDACGRKFENGLGSLAKFSTDFNWKVGVIVINSNGLDSKIGQGLLPFGKYSHPNCRCQVLAIRSRQVIFQPGFFKPGFRINLQKAVALSVFEFESR